MQTVPEQSVDLVFADPPFNIGYHYDQYEDRLDDDQYLNWSWQWMGEVHRVLKPNGTFWLAIGDEYAAELKIEAQRVGFHCRSWVIWYYTFGVHCSKKFTRSHAHLFHFVKDPKDFVFNHECKELRVPSARQLVYNDARANPKGRMPDDTWILRPQQLTDGFCVDEDVWYFPRVAGTFKERAGFHGCQMPEQLLGRIIRACSQEDDVILDPFSGSSTTLAVAKKLGRKFFGFELSEEYVKAGTRRLEAIVVGDRLDGGEEPKVGATSSKKKAGRKQTSQKNQLPLFPDDETINSELIGEMSGIVEAFSASNQGHTVDRVVADPVLNEDFQLACERRSIPGTMAERNRFLFRLRKSGKLNALQIDMSVTTRIGWADVHPFLFASEIAWRHISNKYCNLGLNEIFCDPRIARQFDSIAKAFAPGHEALDYRWAALKLRQVGRHAKSRARQQTPKAFGIESLRKKSLNENHCVRIDQIDFQCIESGAGVYLVKEKDGHSLYAGETNQLAARLKKMFDASGPLERWMERSPNLELHYLSVSTIQDYPFARQSLLLKWHRPEWNSVNELSA